MIIAKKGSKRLKNKNTLDFKGKPMFQWNLEKCLKIFDKTFVSSDSKEILELSEKLGAIPIKRPKSLCGEATNISVYKHALKKMNCDTIVAVQANSPTVSESIIKRVKLLMDKKDEVKTCHKDKSDYGSIWAIRTYKIKKYPDPYNAKPDVWIIDTSVDIHDEDDYRRSRSQWEREHASEQGDDLGSKSVWS